MVTFNLYEVPFSFFFMFGFSEAWGGYEMPDFQRKTMKRKREYQLHYEIGQKWAREIKAGSRPCPTWIYELVDTAGPRLTADGVGARRQNLDEKAAEGSRGAPVAAPWNRRP